MSQLLGSEEWAEWEANIERLWYDESEVAALLSQHATWQEEQVLRRHSKVVAMGQEA